MLEKMGWEKGQGLGKEKDGMKEAIEVKKKEDTLGVSRASPGSSRLQPPARACYAQTEAASSVAALHVELKLVAYSSLSTLAQPAVP
jgi:hypothetical protein